MIRASIAGASGYGGGELLRLLRGHPSVEVACLAAGRRAGEPVGRAWPHLRGLEPGRLAATDAAELADGVDVAFLALPHGTALELAPRLLERGARVVDLGGDYRLTDPDAYARWYGREHTRPELLGGAVYGLPELGGRGLREARLVANPGCYATAATLALLPLVRAGLAAETVYVDGKSGVSGAGRGASAATSFAETDGNVRPYGVAGHRHAPEIEQALGREDRDVRVCFTPHVVPMSRGLMATCSVPLREPRDAGEALDLYRDAYAGASFVRVDEALPQTKDTLGSNFCDLSVRVDAHRETAVALAALDNLGKGAAGQAVQNMNLMFGRDEREGLWTRPIHP